MRIIDKFMVVASALCFSACGRGETAANLPPEVAKALVKKVAIQLTIPCSPIGDSGAGEPPSGLKLATVLVLNSVGGVRMRFVDDHLHPSAVAIGADGHRVVTINYEPEDRHYIEGQEFGKFISVDTLGVRLDPVLRAVGLQVDTSVPLKVRVRVNGVDVVKSSIPYDGSKDAEGFKELDIRKQFIQAGQIYQENIKSSS